MGHRVENGLGIKLHVTEKKSLQTSTIALPARFHVFVVDGYCSSQFEVEMHKTGKSKAEKQIEFGLIQLAPFQLTIIRRIWKLNSKCNIQHIYISFQFNRFDSK